MLGRFVTPRMVEIELSRTDHLPCLVHVSGTEIHLRYTEIQVRIQRGDML
jgi:hypothetical protein